jgi:hypothetical protein
MLLISEPEAAAVYTARYLTERNGADFLEVCAFDRERTLAGTHIGDRKTSALFCAMQEEELSYVKPIRKRPCSVLTLTI